jgi:ubiquinone biosynthesis protein Coq4
MLNNHNQVISINQLSCFVFQSTLRMRIPFYKLRCRFLEKLFEVSVYAYLLFFKRNKESWEISTQDLQNYKEGTLGKSLYIFLLHNGFEVQNKLESHDVFHVLTETGTTVPEEISMQYRLYACGKRSIYGFITMALGTLVIPEKSELYFSSYRMGKRMVDLSTWDLKSLLNEPINELRKQIYQQHEYKRTYHHV